VNLIEEKTTAGIIGAFYEVYNRLGFGFLEHAYALAMERELLARATLCGGKSLWSSTTKVSR
jgi:hypothetical protein